MGGRDFLYRAFFDSEEALGFGSNPNGSLVIFEDDIDLNGFGESGDFCKLRVLIESHEIRADCEPDLSIGVAGEGGLEPGGDTLWRFDLKNFITFDIANPIGVGDPGAAFYIIDHAHGLPMEKAVAAVESVQ